MRKILSIYEVSRVGLHSEVEAIGFTGLDGDVCGGFIKVTLLGKLRRWVNSDTDGVVVSGVS